MCNTGRLLDPTAIMPLLIISALRTSNRQLTTSDANDLEPAKLLRSMFHYCFRNRQGSRQSLSNQWCQKGAIDFTRTGRRCHHTHRKSICTCQRTPGCKYYFSDAYTKFGIFLLQSNSTFFLPNFFFFFLVLTAFL